MKKAIKRDSSSLNELLFAEIQSLRDGKTTPQQAREVARIINTMVSVKKLEVDMARFVSEPVSNSRKLLTIDM